MVRINISMDVQFNDLSEPDQNVGYYCSLYEKSTGFSYLMKLVLMVRAHPEVLPIIRSLIKDPNRVDEINEKGWTSLMIACRNSNTYSNNLVVKMLIDAGADVNIKTIKKWTPLGLACVYPSDSTTETIEILIDAGSDIIAKTVQGWTISMYAVLYPNDNIHILKKLIDAGADIDDKDRDGLTCLAIAGRHNKPEAIKILIGAGADVNIKYYSKTFLMVLFRRIESLKSYGNIIIQLLHTSKETLLDTDDNGKSAYDYYVENGHDVLDEYYLKILKGDIRHNNTKSARVY